MEISSLERQIAKKNHVLEDNQWYLEGSWGKVWNPSCSHIWLQERLLNTIQEPRMTIVEYFTKVKSLCDEIDDLRPLPQCNCHPTTNFVKIQQDQRLMTFLMKLDPQFHQVRTNSLMERHGC